MVLYVEDVLFENMIIDGLLLFLVAKTLRLRCGFWGIFFSSLFGSLFALFSVKIEAQGILGAGIKLFVCFCMAYILDFSFKSIIKKSFFVFAYTFLFGGMASFVFGFLGVSTKNGISFVYQNGVPIVGLCVLSVILFLCLLAFLKKLYQKKKISAFLYDITLSVNKKTANLLGFLDTGNTLQEKNSGKPILMLSKKELKKFFGADEMLSIMLKKYQSLDVLNPQTIKVSSISGTTDIFAFEAEKCLIEGKNVKVFVGVYEDEIFKNKGFDAILSPKMLEGGKCLNS